MIGFDLTVLAFVDPEADVPLAAFVLGGSFVFTPPRKLDVFHPSEAVRALPETGVEIGGGTEVDDGGAGWT